MTRCAGPNTVPFGGLERGFDVIACIGKDLSRICESILLIFKLSPIRSRNRFTERGGETYIFVDISIFYSSECFETKLFRRFIEW